MFVCGGGWSCDRVVIVVCGIFLFDAIVVGVSDCGFGVFAVVVIVVVMGTCVGVVTSLVVLSILGFLGSRGPVTSPSDADELVASASCVGGGVCVAAFGGEGGWYGDGVDMGAHIGPKGSTCYPFLRQAPFNNFPNEATSEKLPYVVGHTF